MNFTTQWMQSDWMKALGWTFVHSLWQIAAIGLLLYIILRLIPGRSAHVRYTISTMAIWMIVMMALSTFIIMLPGTKPIQEFSGQVILVKTSGNISMTDRISIWLESRMPLMLSIWFGGVLILMLRLTVSIAWVQHMRSVASPLLSVQQTVNDLIHRLKLRIKPIASESGYVGSPVTIGHIKPMILFPIGIINQLSPSEVEAVLTHELAHIVRRDYLSNLIQSFIETLFYYHPVTWWISNKVRTERENRADDLAVSWCGDHLGYVKALLTVQEMQLGLAPSLAIGFASDKGAMLARIQRILHIPYKNHNQMEKTVLISLCSLFFFGFTLNSHTNLNQKKENQLAPKEQITVVATIPDSIPSKGTYKIHKKTDDQDISIEVRDGDIKELKIDGKNIAPAQFDQYDEVIDELFGAVETPPSAEGFNFTMPTMPPVPDMPPMPNMPPMPDMPPMPPMPPMPAMGMNSEEMLESLKDKMNENGYTMEIYNPTIKGKNFKFFGDTTIANGKNKIIIITGKDSINVSDFFNGSGDAPAMNFDYNILQNSDEWKANQENWKQMQNDWKQNWEEKSQQWKEGSKELQEKLEDE
ncbi:MAG: M56 family metallopeptidase, partial [Saprospiraceae bacterium]